MSWWMRGVVASALLVLTGCTSDLPDLSRADADACAELTAALPGQVAGEDITDDSDRTTSWGGIELSCGVDVPASYDDFSACSVVGGVGWFLPPDELKDTTADIEVTALTYSPRVSVLIPAEHRGSDEVLAAISPAIARTLTEGDPCL